MRRTQPVELAEQRGLELQPLGHRLHDEVARGELAAGSGEPEPVEYHRLFGGVQPAAVDGSLQRAGHPAPSGVEEVVVDLDGYHGGAAAGEDLGDPGTHRAEPDNSHGLHAHHSLGVSGSSPRSSS